MVRPRRASEHARRRRRRRERPRRVDAAPGDRYGDHVRYEHGHADRERHQRLVTLRRVARRHDDPHQHERADEFGDECVTDGQIGLDRIRSEAADAP